jgi:hypothetical protein
MLAIRAKSTVTTNAERAAQIGQLGQDRREHGATFLAVIDSDFLPDLLFNGTQ